MILHCSLSPKSPNRYHGQHWAMRRKDKQRIKDALYFENECLRGASLRSNRPTPPLRVTYERRHARVPMDLDNLAGSAKVVLDALQDLRVIEDDKPAIIAEFVSRQQKVNTVKEEGFSITLETISEEE